MPLETTIVLGLLITAVGLTLWKGFAYLNKYRLITGTPTSKIRSAHQGYVEVIGHISEASDNALRAPLSGRECVWYSFSVSRFQSTGKKHSWRIERQGSSDQFFQVDDGSGKCLVDPEGATVKAENVRTWYGDTPSPSQYSSSPQASDNMFSGMFNTHFNGSNYRYRYQERLLFAHEKIYILGQFESTGGGRHLDTLKQMTGDVIREWKLSYPDLLKEFDTNKDNTLDIQEWNKVQQAAEQEAKKRRSSESALPTTHIIQRPPISQHPYLISTHDEEKLAIKYGWYAVAAVVALIVEGYFLLKFFYS